MLRCIAIGAITVALSALTIPARAVGAEKDDAGIPSTSVARLKIGQGTAWVRSGDSGEWQEAGHNYTLAERSRVSVPQGSEAEIQFRGSQSLFLRGGSEVDIGRLGEKEAAYRLRSGQAALSLPKADFAPVRIMIPGTREVRIDVPGHYTLTADRGITTFHVRAGEGAVISGEGPPTAVKAGEEASIGEEIRVSRVDTAAPEPVEEAPLTEAETAAGIPPAAAGELRQYGEWVSTPEYGYAWRPYVDDGWEPYYYGRWAWVSPYGWTWVGYEPWGWWPYHTGWWWPSPVFGWVWCPFHSFASVHFTFGRSVFFGHHARFFPANVRFIGRDRFVRWVPARPGEIVARSNSFSRRDSRLARWDRTIERGAVRVRRDGGRTVAWEGRGGGSRGAVTGVRTNSPRTDLRTGGSSVSRTRDGSAVRGRQANDGAVSRPVRRGDTRAPSLGRGSATGNSGRFNGPARNSVPRVQPSRPGGGSSRSGIRGGSSRGFVGGGSSRSGVSGGSSRGFVGGGSFRSGVSGGSSRGFVGGGSSRSFGGGGSLRGGGSRGSGGGGGSRGPAGGRSRGR